MTASHKALLDALVAETWDAYVAREPYTATSTGRRVEAIGRRDLSEAEGVAAAARTRRERLDQIDASGFDRTDRLSVAYLRHWFDSETEEPARWWTGFAIAPYCATYLSMLPRLLFAGIDLTDTAEADRYLKLARDFVGMIDATREQVEAQAARGWRLPRSALANARKSLEGHAGIAASAIQLADGRSASDATRAAIETLVERRLQPAFARLLDAIGPAYEAAAPDSVGLMHQPGGAEAYRLWVRYHLGADLDPADLHRLGLDEVADLSAQMARLRIERFGHRGDEASFHQALRRDPRAKAATAEALEGTYRRHLDRMKPAFARMFRRAPRAEGLLARLPVALEAGMAFGYYQAPQGPGSNGIYYFSGNGIPDRLQINAAALIFHELVPGHHVHLARQQENDRLPEMRREMPISTAFNEGWAEYASGLGDDAGLFDDPYDHYGYLSHQRFTAQRLVVDTGLNALGWSFEQAHAFMSANTLEEPDKITGELMRYATDLPGQALCYRWGALQFRKLRARATATLGDRFDLAEFHEAILDQGALPIPVLEQSLSAWAAERAGAQPDINDTEGETI